VENETKKNGCPGKGRENGDGEFGGLPPQRKMGGLGVLGNPLSPQKRCRPTPKKKEVNATRAYGERIVLNRRTKSKQGGGTGVGRKKKIAEITKKKHKREKIEGS